MESLAPVYVDAEETRNQVLFGGLRAAGFVNKVVKGEAIDGKKYGSFGYDFLVALHDRVCMSPGITAGLRQTDSTTVGGDPVTTSYVELPHKFRAYCNWLEREIDLLKEDPSDIVAGLRVAAAAHFGLTCPALHPFDNGNGRTARALVNAILMLNTYELLNYGLAIPPVPILRSVKLNKKGDPYIIAIRAIAETHSLNPFMSFLAVKWSENLQERLKELEGMDKIHSTEADRQLIGIMRTRLESLRKFVDEGKPRYKWEKNKKVMIKQGQTYPVPNYFVMKHVKFSYA